MKRATGISTSFDYLNREGIPIISSDTGGTNPRKIFYDPASSKIWQNGYFNLGICKWHR